MRTLAAALGVVLVAAGVYAVGLATPAQPPVLQGDTLGLQPGEGWEEYEGRAEASLSESSAPAFALVTFVAPQEPAEAARAVAPAGRVDALMLADAPTQPIPEPPTGQTRAEVLAREAERLARAGAANGVELDPRAIVAVVVRDDGDTLRAIAGDDTVRAVEVLPPDAVWGTFGITPGV